MVGTEDTFKRPGQQRIASRWRPDWDHSVSAVLAPGVAGDKNELVGLNIGAHKRAQAWMKGVDAG